MSDELRIKVVLDNGDVKEGFLSLEKQADKTAKKVGQSFDKKGSGLENLAEGAEAVAGGIGSMTQAAIRAAGPYGTLAAAIATAATATVGMAFAGEQVVAINAQFANVASSAGLAAEQFGESIIKATEGLIDDEDALKIATQGIIALGDQASKIPAILDAARGASRALGKDFKTTFEDLSTFVEFGNARVLRNYGIVLDLEKAYSDAAKSIGLTSAALTEQQKQQVRANLVLDEVPKKFSAAASSVTPLKDAFDRLKVSAENALESISVKTNKKTGGFLASFINELTEVTKNGLTAGQAITLLLNPTALLASILKEASTSAKVLASTSLEVLRTKSTETANEIDVLNSKILELTKERKEAKGISNLAGIDVTIASYKNEIKSLQQELNLVDTEITKQTAARGSQNFADQALPEPLKKTKAQNDLTEKEDLKRLNDLQAYVSAQDKLVIDAEIKRIETLTNLDQKLTAQKVSNDQQSILLEQQKNAALAQVNEQFSTEKGFSQEQRDIAALAVKQNFHLQEQALEQQNADKIKLIEDSKNLGVLNSYKSFTTGFSAATDEFRLNAAKNFQEVGKQAFRTIATGVGSAFSAYGKALKAGDDAGQAFLDSTLKLFGDLATNLGTYYITLGLAKLFATPKEQAEAPALISAGAALAVLGGFLGGTGPQAKEDTGGGIASSPSTSTDLTQPQDLQRAEATTGVSVVIQGDVLDSDESGSRIVALINSAFDKKGVVINQGVMA